MQIKQINSEKIIQALGERVPIKINPPRFLGYTRIVNAEDYSIYKAPRGHKKVVAAFGDTVVFKTDDVTIQLVPQVSIPWICYTVRLENKTFPGLWKGSKILACLLLPYMRILKSDTYEKSVRLCVFTDKGQIFHNYPSRAVNCDGNSVCGDICRFEESVIWDIPGRKHPSKKMNGLDVERYFPNLPETCYEYSPLPRSHKNYRDIYGNGGFDEYRECENGVRVSRFYRYSRRPQANSFAFIGTAERNDKMNIIGTYRSNVEEGVRIAIFATSDGGREWFCKYEFSDTGDYSFQQGHTGNWGKNFGNPIILTPPQESDSAVLSGIKIMKRSICLPTDSDGKIVGHFDWEEVGAVEACVSLNTLTIRTNRPHFLTTGNIVCLTRGESGRYPDWLSWIICSMGTTNENPIQFKVNVLDEVTIELYELVSNPMASLPCRHIHHINPVKDGWIIGTGEIYPNGWLLYFQQKMADSYSIVHAKERFSIRRMNTTRKSVQRTMGAFFLDEKDPTMVYASDHDVLEMDDLNLTFMEGISRNSIGIYEGKLKDIDDRTKFSCVLEMVEPCYYFQKLDGMYVVSGQRGELAICFDRTLREWKREHVNRALMYYYGNCHQYQFFNDYIIYRKK